VIEFQFYDPVTTTTASDDPWTAPPDAKESESAHPWNVKIHSQTDVYNAWRYGIQGSLLKVKDIRAIMEQSECYDQPIIVVRVRISDKLGSHANVLIINHERKEYERFEPHGSVVGYAEHENKTVDVFFESKEFQEWVGIEHYLYVSPLISCPGPGPQRTSLAERKRCPEAGWCAAWVLLYATNRMLNSRWSRDKALLATQRIYPFGSADYKIRRFHSFVKDIVHF
jgi:hypothetical protein